MMFRLLNNAQRLLCYADRKRTLERAFTTALVVEHELDMCFIELLLHLNDRRWQYNPQN